MEVGVFVVGGVMAVLGLLAVYALVEIERAVKAALAEAQKTNAVLFLVHDLVEGPTVKGKPRIVRAADHLRGPAIP